jgi:CRP-like cAMP-binding protein
VANGVESTVSIEQGGSVAVAEYPHRLWLVRNFDLFKCLSDAELRTLADQSRVVRFERNDHICMSGVRHTHAYLVKEGNVRVVATNSQGKRLTLAILKPGELIGDIDLFGDREATTVESAEAVDSASLLAVPIDILRTLVINKPELSLAVHKLIGDRRAEILNRMQDVLFLTVPERLARLILRLAKDYPGESKTGRRFVNLRLTHAEFADLIGSNREAVSATFGKWKAAGPVDTVKGFVVIKDEAALKQIASN